jgi:hypothetical protein
MKGHRMTTHEFDRPVSSPRHCEAVAGQSKVTFLRSTRRTTATPVEFHATMADVTNEQHQNTPGLVDSEDFNPGLIVEFLRSHEIEARVDEAGEGFYFTLDDPKRESEVIFACVCLRASLSYAIEASVWCWEAQS